MKRSTLAIAISFTLAIFPLTRAWGATATPSVSGVSGTVSDGQQVTVSGSGFGTSGPDIQLYDDFSGGPSGSIVPLTSPEIGEWTKYSSTSTSYHPIYSNESVHSPPYSEQIYRNGASSIMKKFFAAPVTEAFVSWWVRIPDGTKFPYYTDPGTATFATGSNWKYTWLMDGEHKSDGTGGNGYYDLCVPSYTNTDLARMAGNSYTPSPNIDWNITKWWSWTHWMRMTAWLKANQTDPTQNGTFYWQAFAEGQHNMTYQTITDQPVFRADSTAPDPPQWTLVSFPGWLRENDTDVRPLYDDVYIAAGANAAARIEIGDNPVYTDCGNLELLTPTSWSDGKIVATVRQGSFTSGQTAYVFVFDANNNGNTSSGYKVTIGGTITSTSSGSTTTAPNPPQNLRIVQ